MGQSNEPRLYSATINTEGASETLRGKIPSGLLRQMGADKGDCLELEVTGKFITGGRILRGRNADMARERALTQSREVTSSPKPKAKVSSKQAQPSKPSKPTLKKKVATTSAKPSAAPKKITKVEAKPSKRTTKVNYKGQEKAEKAGSKPKLKLKRR